MDNNYEGFFTKEVLGEGVIGGGLVNVGTTFVNNGVCGLANLNGNAKTALVTVFELLEGYGAAVAEEKVKNPIVKGVLHGAKYIIPGQIPVQLADRAGMVKVGSSFGDWSYTKGIRGRAWIAAKVRRPTSSIVVH